MTDLSIKTAELFTCTIPFLTELFESTEYPWDILPLIKEYIKRLVDEGIEGYTRLTDTVLVGENVTIAPTAVIEGYAILGAGTAVRPGAYLRGNIITGADCVIGNSSELKNCILMEHVQVPHYNYVGDSILGFRAHMGAGSICSNFRSDGGNVTIHGDRDYETGLRKVGAFLGDRAEIGCGAVLNPGTIIGKGTSVYPLTPVRGVIPAGHIVKSSTSIVLRREELS